MFAEKCHALPTHSAAEQFPFGALCEPASLLIYLLVKEITIAVITGRCVSKSEVGLSKYAGWGWQSQPHRKLLLKACVWNGAAPAALLWG